MPRFFFSVEASTKGNSDEIVFDLADEAAARAKAVELLLPIDKADVPAGDNEYRSWSVTVLDEHRHVIVRVMMALLVENVRGGPDRVFEEARNSKGECQDCLEFPTP